MKRQLLIDENLVSQENLDINSKKKKRRKEKTAKIWTI